MDCAHAAVTTARGQLATLAWGYTRARGPIRSPPPTPRPWLTPGGEADVQRDLAPRTPAWQAMADCPRIPREALTRGQPVTLGMDLSRRPRLEIRGSSILAEPPTRATRRASSHPPPIPALPTRGTGLARRRPIEGSRPTPAVRTSEGQARSQHRGAIQTRASPTLDTPIRVTRTRDTAISGTPIRGMPTRGPLIRGPPIRGSLIRDMPTHGPLIRDLLIRDLLIRDSWTLGSRQTLAIRQISGAQISGARISRARISWAQISRAQPESAEPQRLGSCPDRRGRSRTAAWPSRHPDRQAMLARQLTRPVRAIATHSPSALPTL